MEEEEEGHGMIYHYRPCCIRQNGAWIGKKMVGKRFKDSSPMGRSVNP